MTLGGFSLEQLAILPISVAAFIVLLTVIVFIHEYGHFLMARALGVRVDVFSIGFGKPLARWVDRKGTEWRIAMLPFGGYVKFFGDASAASNASEEVVGEKSGKPAAGPATTQFPRPADAEEASVGMTEEERRVCFHFKPVWARAAIVSAGPMANFLLAIVIFSGLLMTFGEIAWEPRVGTVVEDSAAAEAGFQAGDVVVSVNGRKVRKFDDLQMQTRLSAGETLRFEIDRGGATIFIDAAPRRQEILDGFGNKAEVGVLGLRPVEGGYRFVTYNVADAVSAAIGKVWNIIASTTKFLYRLALGKEDARQLGGPIKMAQYAGQSAVSGFEDAGGEGPGPSFLAMLKVSVANFINLAAVVSVSIGFLNLLPIPVLDGGHLMYYAYEGIAGRPLGARAQAVGFRVGIIFLASFMLFVMWNDVTGLISFNS